MKELRHHATVGYKTPPYITISCLFVGWHFICHLGIKVINVYRQKPSYIYFLLLLLAINVPAFSDDNPISLSSKTINQGGIAYIKITKMDADEPEVKWIYKKVSLIYCPEKKIYVGFIAADLEQKPGTYNLYLLFKPSGIEKQIKIKIKEKDYGVRKLTVPDNQVNLSEEDLARADEESAIMNELWDASVSSPFWNAPFIMPLDSEVIGTFGRKSIINDQPRSPHSGVDMRGETGTPVKASNDGMVVLTGDHFFTGNTIVIDHGAGILSMYFHLDKINVKKDDKILKGEIIGSVGSTGRSTGPHLHWGVRVEGQRVDPVSFVKISNKLEEK